MTLSNYAGDQGLLHNKLGAAPSGIYKFDHKSRCVFDENVRINNGTERSSLKRMKN